jgi:DNA-binding PadR family transcriptional regulator
MVRKKIIYQKDRPNKKVYSLTEKGEKELNTWLKDPSFSSVMREEFLIKAFFFGLIDKTTALAQIERYHQRHNQLLEEYLNLEKILKSLIESPKERKIKLYWYLTLKCGIRCSKALIDWCDEVKKEILNLK